MAYHKKYNLKLILMILISCLIIAWYFTFNYERNYGFLISLLEIIVNIILYNIIMYLLSKHIAIKNIYDLSIYVLFQIYLWILYVITVYVSIGFIVFADSQHQFRGKLHFPINFINIVPFHSIIHTFSDIPSLATYVQIIGNFFLLAPLCFFLLFFHVRSAKSSILLAFCFSISIEIIQLVQNFFLSTYIYGVDRFSDVDDIILNTGGSFIGVIIYKFARLIKKHLFD